MHHHVHGKCSDACMLAFFPGYVYGVGVEHAQAPNDVLFHPSWSGYVTPKGKRRSAWHCTNEWNEVWPTIHNWIIPSTYTDGYTLWCETTMLPMGTTLMWRRGLHLISTWPTADGLIITHHVVIVTHRIMQERTLIHTGMQTPPSNTSLVAPPFPSPPPPTLLILLMSITPPPTLPLLPSYFKESQKPIYSFSGRR